MLRRYRTAAGFSQEHLADLARLSVESVGALERGARRAPYRGTVALLAEALKLDPADRATLEAAADRGRARSAKDDGQAAIVPNPALPLQTTPFVGRASDLASLAALLAENRLVTVTGSGGVGKTRVAIELAARLPSAPRDGIRFVDLSPLNDARFIVGAIASRLAVSLTDRAAAIEELVSALRSTHALIVLDNCEHLIADVALLVTAILRGCPQVSFLATSRERLAVNGEVVYRLPSLEMPARPPSGMEQARRYAAIELFVQRATTADRSIRFGDNAVDSIVDVCRKLDGIPLAIELAAARMSTLGLENLRARLNHGMTVTGRARDLPARQQTMLATIGWSYDLLDDLERTVLQRTSVFVGGFTLAAAEAVCTDEAIDSGAVADILSSLVEKSLINVALADGSARYSILDSVKAFAHGHLIAAGQAEKLSLRHAEWMAAFADWIDATRTGKPEPWLRTQTAPELENARTALTWALETAPEKHALLAGRIVGGLRTIWLTSGRRDECARWAQAAISEIDEQEHLEVVARLLRALVQSTEDSEAAPWRSRALSVFERVGDRMGTALLRSHLALDHRRRGRLEESDIEIARASDLFADLPRSMPYVSFLQNRWQNHIENGRYEQALSDIAEATAIVTSLGDVDAYQWRLFREDVRAYMGERPEAIRSIETILEALRTEAIRTNEATYERELIMGYTILALARLAEGDLAPGAAAANEALVRARLRRGDEYLATAMYAGALAAALYGEERFAAKLAGAAHAVFAFVAGISRMYRDTLLQQTLLRKLTPKQLESLHAEGAAQPLDAIIAEALNVLRADRIA